MSNGRPLFPGSSDEDQLLRIFKLLGTPDPSSWPQMLELAEYKADFPVYEPQPWSFIVPNLDAQGVDLLSKMLRYDPAQRISARQAMEHLYFRYILLYLCVCVCEIGLICCVHHSVNSTQLVVKQLSCILHRVVDAFLCSGNTHFIQHTFCRVNSEM